jgi:endonuclease G
MIRELLWCALLVACTQGPPPKNEPPAVSGNSQSLTNNTNQTNNPNQIVDLALPLLINGETMVHHFAYDLVYSEQHEQAKWVAYELNKTETVSLYERNDRFMVDPDIKTGSATDADYAGYNYDRGHLAPAADMGWSATAMKESFYYSNMSPQVASFNRGVWKRLETQVRSWAIEDSSIYIVTGPILKDNLLQIGPNGVSVPNQYYKVVLEYTPKHKKALGFVLPNLGSSLPLQSFAVSVDSVERLTGVDFFHNLPNQDEAELESSVCLNCWSWGAVKTGGNSAKNKTESTQCKGITKAGLRCKRMTLNPNGFCQQHGGN